MGVHLARYIRDAQVLPNKVRKSEEVCSIDHDHLLPMKALFHVSECCEKMNCRSNPPVITNHATRERRDSGASPYSPVVDGLRRRPVFDDCEETHGVDFAPG